MNFCVQTQQIIEPNTSMHYLTIMIH